MDLNIVMRAADPAGAAATLRALGIELERPNRPNPARWHGWGRVCISVEACEDGEEPSICLGFRGVDRRLAEVGQQVRCERDASGALVDAGGIPMRVLEHSGPVARPSGDRSLLLHAEVVICDAREELSAAVAATGIRELRLVGPQLLLGRYEPLFTLVVDGADQAGIATLNAILERHSDDAMRIVARPAEDFDEATLQRIDQLAWDLLL